MRLPRYPNPTLFQLSPVHPSAQGKMTMKSKSAQGRGPRRDPKGYHWRTHGINRRPREDTRRDSESENRTVSDESRSLPVTHHTTSLEILASSGAITIRQTIVNLRTP